MLVAEHSQAAGDARRAEVKAPAQIDPPRGWRGAGERYCTPREPVFYI
jgi:hypothetical protein